MALTNYSHTSLSAFRRCKKRFYWRYVEGIKAKSSIGLIRGSAGHSALSLWYEKKDPDLARQAIEEEFIRNDMGSATKEIEETKYILTRYFNWSAANDDFEVIAAEQKFELALPDRKVKLIGYIDEIVRKQNGDIWFMENKFNKHASLSHTALDPQVSMYLIGGTVMQYMPKGVIYNIIRMTKGGIAETEPVLRIPLVRSPKGLAVILDEYITQIDEMERLQQEDKEELFYRNPTRDCSWDCEYYTVCLAVNEDGKPGNTLEELAPWEEKSEGKEEE